MEHGAWGMGHGAESRTFLMFCCYALCALHNAVCVMRKIEEVRMSEEVRIYTTPT
jgi:hypothetical protein